MSQNSSTIRAMHVVDILKVFFKVSFQFTAGTVIFSFELLILISQK